ncbi:MFS transporter [Paramicrobacterium fandaimingii]|uniref:MFS transporter n=1 Tax=Paramicrobacterium fandaimingii TaxID=2708079 RepID=UPI001422518F|nr:MFS transporter [Microbacterium fandaimingii]
MTMMTAEVNIEPRAGAREWLGLAVLMLPVLLISVDNTILNFALPQISEALLPTGTQLLWIIDVYPLVLAGLLVSMGSLGDRVGRRKLLLIGAAGFGVVSIFAAYSPSAEALIAARAALGLFGATLMPSTLSLLRNLFVNREQRRLAVAIWGSAFAGGGALGPIAGGFLLEHFWWGSIFLLSVPVLLPLFILLPIVVRESKDPVDSPIDLLSALLVLLAMVPFVWSIKHAADAGIDALAIGVFVGAIVFGALFVRRQLRLQHPMLDVSLFRIPAFSGAIVINLLSIIAFVGGLFFITQHLQLVLGMSPMNAGLVLVPGLAVMITAGLLVVPIARRVRPSIVIACALVFSVLCYGSIAVQGGSVSALGIALAVVALGIGVGAAETVSNDLILANAPASKAGAASGLSETAYELGSVLGVATLGTVLTASYSNHIVIPAGVSGADAAAAAETLGGAMKVAEQLPAKLGDALSQAAITAFSSGASITAWLGAGLVVVAIIVSLTTLRNAK